MSFIEDRHSAARQSLLDILSEQGPLLGARLKPALTSRLAQRLGITQIEASYLVSRLSHFLAAHSDLVEVSRPADLTGDILVSLRAQSHPQPSQVATAQIWYRPDVWHAFVNPDPSRRRFFHRETREVVHYFPESSTSPHPQIARRVQSDPAFLEIQFPLGDEQSSWMSEFLDSTKTLPEAQRKVGRHFATVPFESAVHQAFAAAMGPFSEAWRRFRNERLDAYIRAWAARNNVSVGDLQSLPEPKSPPQPIPPVAMVSAIPPSVPNQPSLRELLKSLLDSMDDAELRAIQLPASALLRRGTSN